MKKQETTLEEAAEKYYEDNIDESNIPREHYEWEIQDLMIGFANQWEQERMYSEEEVIEILKSLVQHPTKPGYKRRDIVQFIEEFKKK